MRKFLKILPKIFITVLLMALAYGLSYLPVYLQPYLVAGVLLAALLCLIILRDPMWGIYMLIFFLPFERIGSYDISGVTIRISQVVAVLAILAWIFRGLKLQKFKLRPNPIFWPIIIFLVINLLGLLNAINFQRSLYVWIFTAFTISVSIILPNIIRHGDQLPRLIKILYASVFIVTIFGLYQFMGDIIGLSPSLTGLRPQYTKDILGFPRIQSTALEPLYFANYLLIPLSIILSLVLSKSKKIKPLFSISLLALAGINLILTVARGGYIAFAACCLFICIIYFKKLFSLRNIIYLTMAIIIIGIGANYFLNYEDAKENFIEHSSNLFTGASYFERVYTIEKAMTAWREHPWIGIGPGSFGPYTSFHPLIEPASGYLIVNNEYVELLAETGILGLAVFIIIALIIIVRSLKAILKAEDHFIKVILIGLLTAFIGILVQYNTFSVLYIMHIWVTIGLLIACQNIVFLKKYEK
jgi:O-antigen ligase